MPRRQPSVEDPQAQALRDQKQEVYILFERPFSSHTAFLVNGVIFLCIILSTITFVCETLPFFRVPPFTEWFWQLEIAFVVVFTVEYAARFWSTPEAKCRFMCRPMNVLDLLAILPVYLEFFLLFFMSGQEVQDLRILRVLRLVRVFRLMKIGKYSAEVETLTRSMARSWEALALLASLLFSAMVFFGAVLVTLERGKWNEEMGCYVRNGDSSCSPFESIPMSFYWGVTTMTTVGYGDATPSTPLGKVAACCSMMCGVLIIALPVAVMGEKFVQAYADVTDELRVGKLTEKRETAQEIHNQLQEAFQEYEQLAQRIEEKVPALKQLGKASLVAMKACKGEQQAEDRVASTHALLVAAMEAGRKDMKQFIEHWRRPSRSRTASSHDSPASSRAVAPAPPAPAAP